MKFVFQADEVISGLRCARRVGARHAATAFFPSFLRFSKSLHFAYISASLHLHLCKQVNAKFTHHSIRHFHHFKITIFCRNGSKIESAQVSDLVSGKRLSELSQKCAWTKCNAFRPNGIYISVLWH